MRELVDYLDNVNNRGSFIVFVKELTKERSKAQKLEFENPVKYKYNGALEWQNTSIEQYLECAVSWLEDSNRKDISWKLMAEFLYCGKIYE